jgi:UDP-glucose 4-epimerase
VIVVTGAKGYIGSVLMRKLDALGIDIEDWDIRKPTEPNPDVTCVVHLAALVRVGESVEKPAEYYDTNVTGTLNVIKAYPNAKFIFASTGAAFSPDSPYGHAKVMSEQMIKDICKEYTIFRFYNVGGGVPTNPDGLPGSIIKAKEKGQFTIFGNDYDTKDGTCVRDYFHIEDLTDALVRAVNEPAAMTDYEPLGSGKSYTVKEYVDAYLSKYGNEFEVIYGDRRPGDLGVSEVPFVSKFMTPTKTLEEIV